MRRLVITWMSMFATAVASAHGLLLDAESDGATISGTAYYSNGDRAANEAVSLLDTSVENAPAVTGQTDAEGNFRFPSLASHRYRVTIYGEEGHTVELELLAEAKARPVLLEKAAAVADEPALPPAWAFIGAMLLMSLVPAVLSRKPAKQ